MEGKEREMELEREWKIGEVKHQQGGKKERKSEMVEMVGRERKVEFLREWKIGEIKHQQDGKKERKREMVEMAGWERKGDEIGERMEDWGDKTSTGWRE